MTADPSADVPAKSSLYWIGEYLGVAYLFFIPIGVVHASGNLGSGKWTGIGVGVWFLVSLILSRVVRSRARGMSISELDKFTKASIEKNQEQESDERFRHKCESLLDSVDGEEDVSDTSREYVGDKYIIEIRPREPEAEESVGGENGVKEAK